MPTPLIYSQLSPKILEESGYVAWRALEDGEYLGVLPMTFGKGRLCAGLTHSGYEEGWCYESLLDAIAEMHRWTPGQEAEPSGWMRHPTSGRRRPDGDASKEYVAK